MGLKLESVVPWGRSLREYVGMFDLSAEDLRSGILDCGGGPSSFTAELSRTGGRVVSADPVYAFSAEEIERRIGETYSTIIEGLEASREGYVWGAIRSPEHLGEVRMEAMRLFLEDLPTGLREGRYVPAELPVLPWGDGAFGLALCSHLLFTYSGVLDTPFHLTAIREMCRVAREARIFPLLDTGGGTSPHLARVLEQLGAEGYDAEVRRVPYEFQKGANEMLRVRGPGDRRVETVEK